VTTRIVCYALEPTGQMTPFVEGVSSPIYKRVDDGTLEHVGSRDNVPGIPCMKPGAVYRDSLGLAVLTPGGTWHPEQPSSSGGAWSVSGTPPRITITPSILQTWPRQAGDGRMVHPSGVRDYHAVLTDGVLYEC
jgi:hypothetical protein